MKTKINNIKHTSHSRIENRNANITFMSTILNSIIGMVIGFAVVKFSISLYGEPINGVVRFISQIFGYTLLLVNSLSMVFSAQMIVFYKEKKWNYIFWFNRYIRKIFNYFALGYLVVFAGVGLLSAFMLSSANISFLFVFALFVALALPSFLQILVGQRYSIYFRSINKGYIFDLILTFTKLISFAYFIFIVIVNPPALHSIVNGSSKINIITFVTGDKRIFNLVFAFMILGLAPLFVSFILMIRYRRDYKIFNSNPMEEMPSNEWLKLKKNIFRNFKFSILLGITSLICSSTDEFVMLMLRNKSNYDYILKMVGIYGLYSSLLFSIGGMFSNYVNSKKVLIGLTHKNSYERQQYMKKIKIETYVLAIFFITLTIIFIPLLVNILFNPAKDSLYFNLKFSIPMSLLYMLAIVYLPDYLMMQIDGNFKFLSILSIIEALINLILSISLIKILGIYWVIWASIIARSVKILILKLWMLFHMQQAENAENAEKTNWLFYRKYFIFILIFATLLIIQMTLFLFIDINTLISFAKNNRNALFIIGISLLLLSILFFTYFKNIWNKLKLTPSTLKRK